MYKIEDGWSEFERPLIIAQRARASYSMTDKGNLELNNFFCTQNKKILQSYLYFNLKSTGEAYTHQ